jgi:hypothetical protein
MGMWARKLPIWQLGLLSWRYGIRQLGLPEVLAVPSRRTRASVCRHRRYTASPGCRGKGALLPVPQIPAARSANRHPTIPHSSKAPPLRSCSSTSSTTRTRKKKKKKHDVKRAAAAEDTKAKGKCFWGRDRPGGGGGRPLPRRSKKQEVQEAALPKKPKPRNEKRRRGGGRREAQAKARGASAYQAPKNAHERIKSREGAWVPRCAGGQIRRRAGCQSANPKGPFNGFPSTLGPRPVTWWLV